MSDNSISYISSSMPDSYFEPDLISSQENQRGSNEIEGVEFIKLTEKVRFLKEENERLSKLAEIDALTGLFNRRYFEAHLQKAMNEKKRYPPPAYMNVVVMIDLDKFKPINDTYGHNAGDEALKRVARSLTNQSRYEDIIARLGGDEFIILAAVQNETNANIFLKRLQDRFTNLYLEHGDAKIKLEASFGMITVDPTLSMEEVIHQADMKMFEAKQARRSGHKF